MIGDDRNTLTEAKFVGLCEYYRHTHRYVITRRPVPARQMRQGRQPDIHPASWKHLETRGQVQLGSLGEPFV